MLAALASSPATKALDPDPFPRHSLRHAVYAALLHFGFETAQANAREIREHFDQEISTAFPTYSMSYEVHTLKAASMAEWDRCVWEACKRYDKDQVNAAVSEITAQDANYYRLTHA